MAPKTEQEFHKLFVDLNGAFGIGVVDQGYLKNMKVYCGSILTQRVLENVEECTDLFKALKHNMTIDKDDVSYLRTLLTDCCKDRRDVLEILDNYELGRGHTKTTNVTIGSRRNHTLSPYFDVISREIGKDWRPLARELGLTEAQIDGVVDKYDRNLREQVIEALNVWEESDPYADKNTLIDALRRCEKNKLAGEICNMR